MAGYQKGKLPTEAGRPKLAFNLIYVLTRREKDRNTKTIKQQGARCRCNTLLLLTCQRLQYIVFKFIFKELK